MLSACGGGSSAGSRTPIVTSSAASSFSSSSLSSSPKAAAPTLTITNPEQKIKIGETGSISISTANANSCTEPTLGSIPINGSVDVKPTKGGRAIYKISCTGEGGNVAQEALVVTPYPVYKTSYENKVNVELDSYVLPPNGPWDLNNILGDVNEEWKNSPSVNGLKNIQGFSSRSIAFADFLQNGTMVAIVANTEYKNIYPEANKNNWPDSPGKLYFVQQDPKTKIWTDISSQLFKTDNDRTSVVTPGFFQVADLNNDGRPDVYLAGWGPDFSLANNDWSVLQSDSYVVLSQSDGSYKSIALPINKFFAHQSSLADIDGDGNIDIVTVNNDFTSLKHYLQKPMVLWGRGDGTFSVPDETVFPVDTTDKPIFGLTVISIDGKLNVVLSGGNPNSSVDQWAPSIYGTKVLQFMDGKFQVVQDLTSAIPKIPGSELTFEFVINAGFYNSNWVFLLESPGLVKNADGNYINGALYKMDKNGQNVTAISKTFSWYGAEMTITSNGFLKAMSGSCSLSYLTDKDYCSLNISL